VPRKPWHQVVLHGSNFVDLLSGRITPFQARWTAEGCGCNALAEWLNTLGPSGVEAQFDEVLDLLKQSADDYSKHIRAIPKALRARMVIRLALIECTWNAKREQERWKQEH